MRIGTPPNAGSIVEAYLLYLISVDHFGNELLPSRHNAEMFATNVLIPAWERGEPILFAVDDNGRLIGATFTTFVDPAYQWRVRYAIGHGTWVKEEWRQKGVAKKLLRAVRNMMRGAGITRQIGMAHLRNSDSQSAFARMGFVPHGMILRADL